MDRVRMLVSAITLMGAFLGTVESSHFRGITMSWSPTEDPSKIEVEWLVRFRRTSLTPCDADFVSNGTLIDANEELICDQCSASYAKVAAVKYRCTDFSEVEDWQAGVGSTLFTVQPGISEFDISLASCCWMGLMNTVSYPRDYNAQASVNLNPFGGVINSSPVTSFMPVVRCQQGCSTKLQIPVLDLEGDVVKCRWPSNMAEGGSLNPMPSAILNSDECSLTVNAFNPVGWYGVALMVEDYETSTSSVAKSKIPLQFVLNVYEGYNSSCVDMPELIKPTPDQGECHGAAPGIQMSFEIRAKTFTSAEVIEFETTSPAGMKTSDVSLVTGKLDEYFSIVEWTPTANQIGPHLYCFNALDAEGRSSDIRCVLISVQDAPAVIGSYPVHGSVIIADLSMNTFRFQFDQNVTIAENPTYMQMSSIYGMGLYRGSVTQTAGDTIEISTFGTLYEDEDYSITLVEGVVTSVGRCPIPSARYTMQVRTGTTPTTHFPPFLTDKPIPTTYDTWLPPSTTPPELDTPTWIIEDPWLTNPPPHPDRSTANPNPDTTSSPPEPTVDCSDSGMTVYIPRTLIGDTLASHLHLLDPACVGSHHNSTHVKIATTFDRCGTFMEVRGERAIFFNVVHDEAVPVTTGAVITRDIDVQISVQCVMDLDGLSQVGFRPDTRPIKYYENDFGSFNFTLRLYQNEDYATPYLPGDYPIDVIMGEKLYFEARTWSEPGLELFVQTCRATPSSNSDDFHRYTMIQDGCIKDNTLVFMPEFDPDVQRFVVDVFAFVDTYPQPLVYVHCDMVLCNATDPKSKCAVGCQRDLISSRFSMRKRDVDSRSGSRAYPVTQGPMVFKRQQGVGDSMTSSGTLQMPILLTTICLLVGCLLVLGGVIAVMRTRSKVPYRYAPISDEIDGEY